MIPKIFYFLVILSILILQSQQQQCHYSCLNCTTSSYTGCFACSDSSDIFAVLQNPDSIDSIYRHSIYPSGICTAKVPKGANGLGIILLIISIAGLLVTQSFQGYFIVSTLQTLGLFGLLQVAWITSSGFILQAFQYFMPINLMVSPSKTDDSKLLIYGFYRLDQYIVSSGDTGLIAIFVIDSALFIAIITIFLITLLRARKDRKQQARKLIKHKQLDNDHNLIPQFSYQSQANQKQIKPEKNFNTQSDFVAQQQQDQSRSRLFLLFLDKITECLILRKVLHLLVYVFFFLIQQTVLSIMVGAVFDISALDIAIWIIYFIQIVAIVIIIIYEVEVDKQLNPKKKKTHEFGLNLFLSRQCMLIVLLKKIILPLGIVLPPDVQYVYFIIYILLFLIEGTLESRSGRISCFSRLTLWKIFQMCITTLVLSFYFNQRKGSSKGNANLISIILTICLVVLMVSLICEFLISFFAIFVNIKKVQNEYDQKFVRNQQLLQLNNTEQTINQELKVDQNIFETIQITRDNTNNKQVALTKTNQPDQKYTIKGSMKIQQLSDFQNEPVEYPRKQSEHLVISKAKINQQASMPRKNREKGQKHKTQVSTKVDKSQIQHKQQRQISPIVQHQSYQVDGNERQIQVEKFEQNDSERQPKKPKRRIQDPELRRRYGLK